VKEAEGRCLGGQGLNIVMSRVQNVIVKKGYVTMQTLRRQGSQLLLLPAEGLLGVHGQHQLL
jgi:hypothetical protein